ncbi:MAG: hypothetical protein Q8Q24_01315 [bacterium]|nr:hypothetical protein [bacterium]
MNKNFLLFLAVVVLASLMLIFVTFQLVIPQTSNIFQTGRNLGQVQQKLQILKNKLNDLETLNESELSNRQAVVVKALPTEKNFLLTLGVLVSLANREGLTVESYKSSPGLVLVKEKGRIEYKMTVSGSIEKLKSYLSDVQNSLPLMNPTGKLSIDIKDNTALASVNIETYYFPLPQTLGAIDKPVQKLSADEEKYLNLLISYNSPPESISPLPVIVGRTNPFSF